MPYADTLFSLFTVDARARADYRPISYHHQSGWSQQNARFRPTRLVEFRHHEYCDIRHIICCARHGDYFLISVATIARSFRRFRASPRSIAHFIMGRFRDDARSRLLSPDAAHRRAYGLYYYLRYSVYGGRLLFASVRRSYLFHGPRRADARRYI